VRVLGVFISFVAILALPTPATTNEMPFQAPVAATNQKAPSQTAVPVEFRALYRELDETLRQASESYGVERQLPLPLVAPSLYLAGSG
jgi:hypothetical protein